MDSLKVIGYMQSDFGEKFGIPRQSNLVENLVSTIVFEEDYRKEEAFRGLEGFSYIWIIWGFSGVGQKEWSPMVRPPRLGGNKRMGVFATRSPFRPNPIGLSSVKIAQVRQDTHLGTVIDVYGADLMDGTPIYDIKPYIPFVDSHPEAAVGFASEPPGSVLRVDIGKEWLNKIPETKRDALFKVLEQDPRPAYQDDPERVYGMNFANMEVKFRVVENILIVDKIIHI